MTSFNRIQVRRGSTSDWATVNPTLSSGEFGLDTTLQSYKMGDGTTPWSSLPFTNDSSAGGVSINDVQSLVAAHNQDTTPHTNATSGRDFAALFQNGLI